VKQIRSEQAAAYAFSSVPVSPASRCAGTSELCSGVRCPGAGRSCTSFLSRAEEP